MWKPFTSTRAVISQLIFYEKTIVIGLTLQVTRAENRPNCTCLCCKKCHFHHT